MTKAELIAQVALKAGLSKKDSDKAIGAVIDSITEALASGDKVQLVGFGTFEVKSAAREKAFNPRNQRRNTIAATKAPVFKAGKALKDSVAK